MIWIQTTEAMRTYDNPLVRRAIEKGPIGFLHSIPTRWTARAVYEYRIAKAWQEKMEKYQIPVCFVQPSVAKKGITYEENDLPPSFINWQFVRTNQGNIYKKFTPFYKKARTLPLDTMEPPVHWKKQEKQVVIPSCSVKLPKWTEHFITPFVTEEQVIAQIEASPLHLYHEKRDYIEEEVVTRISPFLASGLITSKMVLALGYTDESFVRQLYWREFAKMTAFYTPTLSTQPLNEKFSSFPWRQDSSQFQKWCEGETGYPIVDAAMRELRTTGYIHNRLRMIVASFLTKHLRIDWRWGEQYFMEYLVDADKANNALNWQWVAGVGVDSSPYFRIFNPIKQGKEFAPTGAYIKKWCPEVSNSHSIQPNALVSHEFARESTLAVYEKWNKETKKLST